MAALGGAGRRQPRAYRRYAVGLQGKARKALHTATPSARSPRGSMNFLRLPGPREVLGAAIGLGAVPWLTFERTTGTCPCGEPALWYLGQQPGVTED